MTVIDSVCTEADFQYCILYLKHSKKGDDAAAAIAAVLWGGQEGGGGRVVPAWIPEHSGSFE